MTSNRTTPKPPTDLHRAGRLLWRSILGELAPDLELDAREVALLARACSCADRIAELEALVDRDGMTTVGSAGQLVLHPGIGEARMQKQVLLRLLAQLDLEGDAGRGTAKSRRGRRGAASRWAYRQPFEKGDPS
jgi:hypothetical protein